MVPDISLSTKQLSSTKKEKARISLTILVNGDSTEQPKLWIISSTKRLQCFKNININNLSIKQQANKKVWITTKIIKDWLAWFWQYLQAKKLGKKVLLLIDNHSAHVKAVKNLKGENSTILHSIEILFLPPNTTSQYQPYDQGVINTFKLYYYQYQT